MFVGELDRATEYLEELLGAYRGVGDGLHVAQILGDLGEVARLRGDTGRAADAFRECLATARELGAKPLVAFASECLGLTLADMGDADTAGPLVAEAVAVYRSTANREGLVGVVEGVALAAARGDDPAGAVCLEEAAARGALAARAPRHPVYEAERERRLGPVRAALAADEIERARARGAAMTLDEAVDYALETLAALTARPRP
jgi:hypothetical protein